MEEKKVWLEVPRFTGENVPVNVAARVMKKDPQFVRQGIIQGLLTFGVAFKKDGYRAGGAICEEKARTEL